MKFLCEVEREKWKVKSDWSLQPYSFKERLRRLNVLFYFQLAAFHFLLFKDYLK